MYLADYHVHSSCSPDGHLTVSEIAEEAIRRGLDEICITDHLDTVYWGSGAPRTDFDWHELQEQVRQARECFGNQLTIRLGAELGEAVLSFDRARTLLDGAPELDFVLGSVHMASARFNHFDLYLMPRGPEKFYRDVIEEYLGDVLTLARWGHFQALAHLTLPLRYLKERLSVEMTFDDWMDRVEEIFSVIIPKGVGIECNTNRGGDPLPGERILKRYREMGGEIITLGSDAHTRADIGCAIAERQELLRSCGFRYFTTFQKGKPTFRPL